MGRCIIGLFVVVGTLAPMRVRAEEPVWIELFNGKDLTGWAVEGTKDQKKGPNGTEPNWFVRDGVIVCAGNGYGFLRYEKPFADFVYHIEYRMYPKLEKKEGNSGIGIRAQPFAPPKMPNPPSISGYEIQLLDDGHKKPNPHSSGSLYRYVAPTALTVKPAPEWNVVDVECVGPRIQVTINGTKVLDVDQTTVEKIAKKPLSGFVSVQCHGTPMEFRNLRIREITPAK